MTFFTVPEARWEKDKLEGQEHQESMRTNIAPSSRTRVDSDNDASFEPESKSSCSVLDFDFAGRVCEIICVHPQESRGLKTS